CGRDPCLRQGHGRVRRDDHLRVEHSRPDPDDLVGNLCFPAGARRRNRGHEADPCLDRRLHGGTRDVGTGKSTCSDTRGGSVMLEISVRHAFPGFTLDARFEAPPGITVLFGRSGSGKTTLINAAAGLLMPDEGRITADNWVLLDTKRGIRLPPHRRRLGYIFQEGRLVPHLTVRQNLRYGAGCETRDAPRAHIDDVVELLGLGPLLARRPGALTGGETQRVAIGRAVLSALCPLLAEKPLAA